MQKKTSQPSPRKPKARRKARRETAAASQALREAVRPSEPPALRIVSLDAGRAHININRSLSVAAALKIIEVLRQDSAVDEI